MASGAEIPTSAAAPGRGATRRTIILDPADNVAVALAELAAGESVEVGPGETIDVAEKISVGHKLARRPIGAGEAVLKYNEVIGLAAAAIAPGQHVHVHNVVSSRLPAPEE